MSAERFMQLSTLAGYIPMLSAEWTASQQCQLQSAGQKTNLVSIAV